MKSKYNCQKICFLLILTLLISCSTEGKKNKNFSFLAVLFNQSSDSSNKQESKEFKEADKPDTPQEKFNIDSEPLYKDQWYLKNTGQGGGVVGLDLNIEPVWKQGYLGQGMNIALIDELIDDQHPDLKVNIAENKKYFSPKNVCEQNHGVPTAGIIASKDNDIGVVGIAPRSKLYARSVNLDNINITDSIDALTRGVEKIAVSSNSWGPPGGFYDKSNIEIHKGIDIGIQKGFNGKGTVYVFAAGNAVTQPLGASNDLSHPGIIPVAGVTKKGNYSPTKGMGHREGWQHWVSAFHEDVLTTDRTDVNGKKCGYVLGNYYKFSGTSAATPMVAGIVALIRQANPALTYRDVKLILAQTAKRDKLPNDKYHWYKAGGVYGKSEKNYFYSPWIGFGVVDAQAAVDLAKNWVLLPSQKIEEYSSTVSTYSIEPNVEKEMVVSIENSSINFVEYIQLSMDFKASNDFPLIRINLHLTDPLDNKATIIPGGLFFGNFYPGINPYLTGYNLYVGENSPNGDWKLKITSRLGTLSGVESVKIKVYGH